MDRKMRISVAIPTLYEAESIGKVLNAINKDKVSEILNVDGGSTDRTVEIARVVTLAVIQLGSLLDQELSWQNLAE
jgi:glycosyltransferase involved in cell wall biosynthesis